MGHAKCVQNCMLVSQNAQLNCLASVLKGLKPEKEEISVAAASLPPMQQVSLTTQGTWRDDSVICVREQSRGSPQSSQAGDCLTSISDILNRKTDAIATDLTADKLDQSTFSLNITVQSDHALESILKILLFCAHKI